MLNKQKKHAQYKKSTHYLQPFYSIQTLNSLISTNEIFILLNISNTIYHRHRYFKTNLCISLNASSQHIHSSCLYGSMIYLSMFMVVRNIKLPSRLFYIFVDYFLRAFSFFANATSVIDNKCQFFKNYSLLRSLSLIHALILSVLIRHHHIFIYLTWP